MTIIVIKDLLSIVPDLINLFLSGFIFMVTYNWLNHKKMDTSILTVWSLFISILVKSLCGLLHEIILVNVIFSDSAKIIIYSLFGFLLAICATWIRKTKLLQKILYKVNNKSVNDDIFDDVIDYNKRTGMFIYLKTSPIVYIGRFLYREENGADSYIALTDYVCLSADDGETIFDPDKSNMLSTVVINLRDIERIQLDYERDSEVWKRFCKNNENIVNEKETIEK